jgi:allantoicase
MTFADLIELSASRLGGTVIAANDEFFASKENLLKSAPPVFIEGKYTDVGKWMDGWETRRKRAPNLDQRFDWCLIRLGLPGIVRGVIVDTSYFRGNYPSHCAIDAASGTEPPATEDNWTEILKRSELRGDATNAFPIDSPNQVTHLRLRIYPDGGVARLRVYGEVTPDWGRLIRRGGEIDLAAVESGGLVLAASDMFFGHRHNLIMPGRAADMSDGWETKRRRGPGHDWAVLRLGHAGELTRIEIDTSWFKGNFPESCSIEVAKSHLAQIEDFDSPEWREILPKTKLQGHTRHVFEDEVKRAGRATHARFNIFPDGGVSRLRLFGQIQ